MNRLIVVAATIAALSDLLMAPAHAGYYVQTTATAANSYNIGASAEYDGKGYSSNMGPPYSYFNANAPYGTASGTIDPTGTATSSFDQASTVSGPYPAMPGLYANSLASANLGDGTLHAFSQNNGVDSSYTGSAGSTALAQFGDTLHFTVGGASDSTATQIGIEYVVHGNMVNTNPAYANLIMQSSLGLNYAPQPDGNTASAVNVSAYANPYYNPIPYVGGANFQSFDPGSGFLSATPSDFTFYGLLTLYGADPSLGITMSMYAQTGDGGIVDFGDTASINFMLPSNVTFTSDSGVFLTASAVPEPASLVLVLVGGVLTALAARFRS